MSDDMNDGYSPLHAAYNENLDMSLEVKVKNNLETYVKFRKSFLIVNSIIIIFYLAIIICQFLFGNYTRIQRLEPEFPTIKSICKGSIEVKDTCSDNCDKLPSYTMQDSVIYVEAFWHMVLVVIIIIFFVNYISEKKKVATHSKTKGMVIKETTYNKYTGAVYDEKIDYKTYKDYKYESRQQTMLDKICTIRILIFFSILMIPYQLFMDWQYNISEYELVFDVFYVYSYNNCFEENKYTEEFRSIYDSNIDSFNLWFYYRHGIKVICGILVIISLTLSIKFFGFKKLILCKQNIKEVSVEEAAKFTDGIKF